MKTALHIALTFSIWLLLWLSSYVLLTALLRHPLTWESNTLGGIFGYFFPQIWRAVRAQYP